MNENLTFSDLEAAIASPTTQPKGFKLRLESAPKPFVAPPLTVRTSDGQDPLKVEVLFLEAPAAVGKSTVAQYISSTHNVPVLDLAKVRVSTGAMLGIIAGDFQDAVAAQASFHAGQLPILIDALDEGRLFSGEQHIEEFLQTTFELLLQNRSIRNQTKLIFLGRPEAQGMAMAARELFGDGVTSAHLELGYFDERTARQLVDANARLVAKPDAAYLNNPVAVDEVIDAYFSAIEEALGIIAGRLWSDEVGRGFAGYAPVLSALGTLLADVDNFSKLTTRLRATGRQEAWQVIELVVSTILEREQVSKFRPALIERIGGNPPQQAYDREEQLRFLALHIDGQQLTSSSRVALSGSELVTYLSMAQQQVLDHPFVRNGQIPNAVLTSLVLVDGVLHDRFRGSGIRLLEAESRQPFFWQAMRRSLEVTKQTLDGRYIGYLLNSFWSDSSSAKANVQVRDSDQEGHARVVVSEGARNIEFDAFMPISFFGRIREIDVRTTGSVRFDGYAASGTNSTFRTEGSKNTVIADEIEVAAENVLLEGATWLEAANISAPSRLNLHLKKGAKVGWGRAVATTYPWSIYASTLPPPIEAVGTRLEELIKECHARLPVGQGVILYSDHTPAENDPHNGWIRNFKSEFPVLISQLLAHGLASETLMEAKGSKPKVKIGFSVNWAEVEEALRSPMTATPALVACLTEVRRRI